MVDLEFDSMSEADPFRATMPQLWSGPGKVVMHTRGARIADLIEVKVI
ncbi:MAG: hypothetical protein ABJA98_13255 [Acidobacteriota bacterium]